ncbi:MULTISPECIES: fructose-specific PTS transporter subunit EIIC [unclassified Luteococcus]|uniref:fructose-specific PTS transporter subunit EIIC n=1 Tax=unclassified Luteococcus TaxID=2639923 RepID=UPI00313B34BE
MSEGKHLVGITACPSGVAHTYLAAEQLQQTALSMGYTMDVETHGSIGVENRLTQESIDRAEAVVIAADKTVELDRFAGKRVVVSGASDGVHKSEELIRKALAASPLELKGSGSHPTGVGDSPIHGDGIGKAIYKNLMNGVSHMIPFVVVGGLFLAFALSLTGEAGVPKGGLAKTIWDVGVLGFTLMVPILSGYIAYAIADRPGLAPGMITGMLATSPAIYHSEASAGFLGGLITGFASGYLALAIKKIPVGRYIQPIMPIIVIPVVTTLTVGGMFVYVLGGPIGHIYTSLTSWMAGMTGASAIVLGIILGLLTGFDLGGPVNKVAYVTMGACITAGNFGPGAMNGVAVAVPPIGLAIAAFVARRYFTDAERQNGIAALFMGCFGITEGAIPFAAARPLQIIPANMIGAATGGALAALLGLTNRIWWGGPIVALLGGTNNPLLFLLCVLVGSCVTAAIAIGLLAVTHRRTKSTQPELAMSTAAAAPLASAPASTNAPVVTGASATTTLTKPAVVITDYLDVRTVELNAAPTSRDEAIRMLVEVAGRSGKVTDPEAVAAEAIRREGQFSTAVGNQIAIPHAKTDGVSSPVVAFARSANGIDWASPSGDLAELMFLIAVPAAAAGKEHLQILAKLSRALAKAPFREGLKAATTDQEVVDLIHEYTK